MDVAALTSPWWGKPVVESKVPDVIEEEEGVRIDEWEGDVTVDKIDLVVRGDEVVISTTGRMENYKPLSGPWWVRLMRYPIKWLKGDRDIDYSTHVMSRSEYSRMVVQQQMLYNIF